MATLADTLADAYAETLGRPLVSGALNAREVEAVRAAEAELASTAFVLDGGGQRAPGLKIARGVYVFEGRDARGAIRVALRVRGDVIDEVAVRGADPCRARGLVGREVASIGHGSPAANPAERVADLLAAGAPPGGATG
jgi:hypothetical protein